jgi:hypothetical protein
MLLGQFQVLNSTGGVVPEYSPTIDLDPDVDADLSVAEAIVNVSPVKDSFRQDSNKGKKQDSNKPVRASDKIAERLKKEHKKKLHYGNVSKTATNQTLNNNVSAPTHTNSTDITDPAMNSKSAANDKNNINSKNMKSILQERFDNLSPAPWPQLDLRIPKAIAEGEMIGFDDGNVNDDPNSPLGVSKTRNVHPSSNTIVTSYYQFKSKHVVEEYRKWFANILQTSDRMIVFVEPGSEWVDFVKKKRTHAPTIVAQITFDELVMSTTFTQEFWDFMYSIDTEAKTHRGTSVYKIWNEKLVSAG